VGSQRDRSMPRSRSQTSPAIRLQATRFSPPKAPQAAVERARLIARIAEREAPLTVICAPAGFGKTTLMQQLRQRYQSRGIATVWLQVDRADNELGRFLQSLVGAVQIALPQFLPPDLADPYQKGTSPAQGLAADLLDRISLAESAIALFLDDLELITDQNACDFLQRLLADLGPHHQVVIGSRTSPGLALGRMRAHGLLLELDQADLRFTREETSTYLTRQSMSAPAVLETLQQRTEGWPVALQLAAITLNAKGKGGSDWLRRFSGSTESVAEYLAQEVLDSRPARQRDFLLRSSVLGEFCAEMCDAVLETNGSSDMIAQILRSNLLLSSIDAEQRWHRYHPLFADFLCTRMQRETPGEMQGLHRRAARWTADEGLTKEAVGHALAAQDHTLAADLLASSAMDMVRSGRVADTARAIAMLPDAEVARRPDLLRAAAFAAVFAHHYTAAARLIETIERTGNRANRDGDDEIAAMRLMLLAWTDRIPEVLETVDAMRSELSRFSPFTAGLASNASAYCNIALGRYVEAEQDLARARQACEPIHALYVLSYSACFSAAIELILGNIASARTTLDSAMNRAIADGQRYGSAGAVVATYLAELLYEANELEACEALVNDYMPIAVETGLPDHLIVLHRIAARLNFQCGRPDAGQGILAQLHEIGARRGIRRLSAAAWLERTYAALRCNDVDGARRALALGSDAALWGSFGEFKLHASDIEDPQIAELRLQLVLGQGNQALPQLEAALQAADATGRRRRALRLLFLRAQILESLGRRREASTTFDTAVTRAAGSGIVRTLVDDGWTIETLSKRATVAGDPRVAPLLRALTRAPVAKVSQTKQIAAGDTSSVAFQLTNREIQILRLLWKGGSNKAIARDLFLTENTIETHLRRIYEKLGTHNRTQAAAIAREAGAI
jgi:LuxR family transcriptional regulator, maltose regulon positive regulatory protein